MQCTKCIHQSVCKHVSYMMENSHIGIQINNCKLYESLTTEDGYNTLTADEGFVLPQKVNVDTVSIEPSGYVDYSSLSNKTSPVKAIPVEINKVMCDRCKKEIPSIDIDNCAECGRSVCIDCRVNTFDPNTGTVTSTCEKCWSGAEDPIPGEEKEVSISFEEKKESWDIKDFIIGEDVSKEEENVTTKQMDNTRPSKKPKKK